MKSIILTISMLFALTSLAQSNCSKYYPFGEGSISEYKTFNKKGKPENTIKNTVGNIRHSGGTTKATINSELLDKKGKSLMATEFDMSCNGDKVIMDFKSLMNNQMMKQFKDSEMKVTGTDIELPNNLSVGQTLPDAGMNMTISMSGINMSIITNITDRKVIGSETITTLAGTFDCIIISQQTSGKMMMAKFNGTQKTWLAEGVGMVKSEDYNAKGKLQSSTVLTAFSK